MRDDRRQCLIDSAASGSGPTLSVATVPEPAVSSLAGLGLLAAMGAIAVREVRRRRVILAS